MTTTEEPTRTAAAAAPPGRPRLAGLDGIRGLAALFVVLHHCYLMSFPGYPHNTGPAWLAWLLYGHLAVVVFIALYLCLAALFLLFMLRYSRREPDPAPSPAAAGEPDARVPSMLY